MHTCATFVVYVHIYWFYCEIKFKFIGTDFTLLTGFKDLISLLSDLAKNFRREFPEFEWNRERPQRWLDKTFKFWEISD